ncbi:MAG: LPS export ABC transporter permease LptF [Leptothrix sp. (in: b-proteobacteria)]
MVFDSTLRQEWSRSFGGTLTVILTIVLTMTLIRALGQAAGGSVSPQDVALLLGYTMLGHLPTILCLSLFVAVVSTMTRLYRDSEMSVWFASGVSLLRFVRPLLRFAWPVLLLVGVLLLLVWPWSNQAIAELRDRYEQRSDLSRVAPGQFQNSSNGQRIFFIDKQAPDSATGRNVFILDQKPDREAVTSAQAGRIDLPSAGGRDLVLSNGARTELDLKGTTRKIARFEQYRVRITDKVAARVETLPPRARQTLDLLDDGSAPARGEVAWRVGLLLGCANLALIGLGLPQGGPRGGGGWTLLLALLTFLVYFNLVNLSQAWVATERTSLAGTLITLHGGAFVIALGLLWWRADGKTRMSWPLHVKAAAA